MESINSSGWLITWCWVFFEMFIGVQVVKNITCIYGNQTFFIIIIVLRADNDPNPSQFFIIILWLHFYPYLCYVSVVFDWYFESKVFYAYASCITRPIYTIKGKVAPVHTLKAGMKAQLNRFLTLMLNGVKE